MKPMDECAFCQILNKELPSKIIYEDDHVLGFKNIQPEAPVHFLFIRKKHLEWKNNFSPDDQILVSRLVLAAKKIAEEMAISQAYKLIFNVGKTGQISHVHLHLLGGWRKKVPTNNI